MDGASCIKIQCILCIFWIQLQADFCFSYDDSLVIGVQCFGIPK